MPTKTARCNHKNEDSRLAWAASFHSRSKLEAWPQPLSFLESHIRLVWKAWHFNTRCEWLWGQRSTGGHNSEGTLRGIWLLEGLTLETRGQCPKLSLDGSCIHALRRRMAIKTYKLLKARENAGDEVVIGFSSASDWLRASCESFGPITERSEAKRKQSLFTFDRLNRKLLCNNNWTRSTQNTAINFFCLTYPDIVRNFVQWLLIVVKSCPETWRVLHFHVLRGLFLSLPSPQKENTSNGRITTI